MKVIVGLGNSGRLYEKTRHNVGFLFLEYFLEKNYKSFTWKKFSSSRYVFLEKERVWFFEPSEGINNSGKSLKEFLTFFKFNKEDVLIIYDDLSLPLSFYKFKEKGSSGGHNGVMNIIEHFGTESFKRLKIGIGKEDKKIEYMKFVLEKFTSFEEKELNKVFLFLSTAIEEWINNKLSFQRLMSNFNKKQKNLIKDS